MASKKTIGAGIGLDGEKEFRQAVSAINNDLSVLKSEMKKVTSEFLDNEKSMESLTARQQVVNKQIEAQTSKVDTLKAALENAKKEYGENSKQVQSWQIKLNNAEADLNKMNKELADIEKQASGIDKVNDELEETAKEADNAEEKTSGLKDSVSKFGEVAKSGATAAATAFAAVGTAIGAVAAGMANLTVDSAAYADEILTTATVVGTNTGYLQAYAYAAELIDVSMDTMTSSMSKNVKSMANAKEGSEAYAEAYKKLGVAITYADGELRESGDVYAEVIDALGEIENETERDALAMQIFGKSAQDLNPLIAQGSEGMRALTEEAEAMGAVLSYETLNELGAFDDSIQRLTAGGSAAKNALGTLLLPQLQTLSDEGVSLIGNFTNGLLEADGDMEKVGEVVAETIESALGIVNDMLPEFLELGADVLGGLIKGISATLSTGEFAESAKSIIDELLTSITDVLPELGTGALGIIVALAEGILDNLPEIIQSGMDVITSLMLGISEAIPELMPTIISVISEIVSVLTNPDNLSALLKAALEIISELGYSLVDAIPQLVDSVIEIIENIAVFLTDPENLALIINCALDLIIALGTGLINAIPELITSVLEISTSIWDSLLETDWGEVGTNIVDGLLEGLKTAWESLKKWFTDSFESLKTSVKDLFDIHSPSRWAKDEIMGNVMRGFGLGIEENEDDIKKQMAAFAATLTDDVEYDLNVNAISARIAAAEPPADILAVTHSQATGGTGDKFDRMLALLEIIAANSKKDILLDKKTLVGELTSDFDTELGDVYSMKARGN